MTHIDTHKYYPLCNRFGSGTFGARDYRQQSRGGASAGRGGGGGGGSHSNPAGAFNAVPQANYFYGGYGGSYGGTYTAQPQAGAPAQDWWGGN